MSDQRTLDCKFLRRAIKLAEHAAALNEVPVGAVVVYENKIIGEGFNQPIRAVDPTAHAEIVALRAAAEAMDNYRLPGTTLYCTLEPCAMCAGAIVQARVERVVFAATDPRAGAVVSIAKLLSHPELNHRAKVDYLFEEEQKTVSDLLKKFFKARR